ncbi:hypothetical protein LPJ63_002115 [Coemansia sp. RSA 2711]|nr:hypothetical protein LPJ63_002115 [Coemansia sp. RSA 2711]
MELGNSEFRLGTTVVLAYPDETRLGGYRAALTLWETLAGNDTAGSNVCFSGFDAKAVEIVQPQDVLQFSVPFDRDSDDGTVDRVPIVLATPPGGSGLSFCFVSGMPAPERIPELVSYLFDLFERQSVERVVIPAAANLAGVKASDQPMVQLPTSGSKHIQSRLTKLSQLPDTAQTSDVFLSTLSNIAAVSGVGEVVHIICSDKRPSGSAYRQTVVFGEEFVDESDAKAVGALLTSLTVATSVSLSASFPSAKATRHRLDIESASKGMQIFG